MQVNSAQDYTTALKRRIVAKSGPQPAHRRYNYVPISVQANRANRVIKQISVPQKSCSGGWVDKSDCCVSVSTAGGPVSVVADFGEFVLNPLSASSGCMCSPDVYNDPGNQCVGLLPGIPNPMTQLTLTFANGSGYEAASVLAIASITGKDPFDFTGTTVTLDGSPVTNIFATLGAVLVNVSGLLSQSSVLVFTFPTPVPTLDIVCLDTIQSINNITVDFDGQELTTTEPPAFINVSIIYGPLINSTRITFTIQNATIPAARCFEFVTPIFDLTGVNVVSITDNSGPVTVDTFYVSNSGHTMDINFSSGLVLPAVVTLDFPSIPTSIYPLDSVKLYNYQITPP